LDRELSTQTDGETFPRIARETGWKSGRETPWELLGKVFMHAAGKVSMDAAGKSPGKAFARAPLGRRLGVDFQVVNGIVQIRRPDAEPPPTAQQSAEAFLLWLQSEPKFVGNWVATFAKLCGVQRREN
jgi:hypothetical protein